MSVPFFQLRRDELQKRIRRLQEYLAQEKIDACLLEDPIDLYYFTGLSFSCGKLWVHKKKTALFVDSRYIEVAEKNSYVQPVFLLKEEAEKTFLLSIRPEKIAFDGATLSYMRAFELQKLLERCSFPFQMIAKDRLTAPIRMIKDLFEIKELKASASLLNKAFLHLRRKLKDGVTEAEIAREFEIYLRQSGAESSAFEPIVAFGKNAAMPHHRAGKTKLKKDNLILMDLGVVVNKYHSDMTRILFNGVPNPILLRLASIVKKAHKAAVSLCKPGVRIGALDEAARAEMRKENMEEYFTHSLGHGIGLETHEPPKVHFSQKDKDLELKPGMVITIEPGLYLPGKGGIRWEDMILITKNGHENLTGSKKSV